ncbi:hypothetical protein [Mesorhizobium captivum]|uniref:hypothetical protein n=1 Tax=Mesorhizobium captivum TaxID=3072319 RepID=UPI002A23FD1C|nr:hypothetical protein [Mesorhizobium sp. VK23E]MDX8516384.1 hypothetical protein [Mesorhizobium sp. VK23E]
MVEKSNFAIIQTDPDGQRADDCGVLVSAIIVSEWQTKLPIRLKKHTAINGDLMGFVFG